MPTYVTLQKIAHVAQKINKSRKLIQIFVVWCSAQSTIECLSSSEAAATKQNQRASVRRILLLCCLRAIRARQISSTVWAIINVSMCVRENSLYNWIIPGSSTTHTNKICALIVHWSRN